LKSVDGGATWYPMVGLPPFASSTATDAMAHIKCSRDPARPGFMLAAFGEKAYRSDNGGESWAKFMDYVDSVEIDPVDASIFYTGGRCGQPLTRHYPGGSFRTYGMDHIHAIAIDPVSHGTLFVAADYATFTSIDFGKTVQGGTSFGEVPEGRMVYDASNGQVLLPTRGGLMIKNSWCLDGDRDGYSPAGGLCGVVDCADDDFKRNPSIRENCLDAVDNDCDGAVDLADTLCIDLCSDKDKDGFLAFGCPGGGDCWDTQPAVFPGAAEVCDGMDNNCDGRYDEGFDEDNDWSTTCSGDCNDHDANIFPWAAEFPFDAIDQNCDGYDLTIKYHRVKYQQTHDYLLVEVGSDYGPDAALELSYFGPLAWDANRKLWVGEFADIQAKPSFITTCGVEGCRDFNINLSKIKVQHEHEILRVEVESAYGEFDNVTVDSYPLAWDPIKKLWIGELLGNSVMPAYLTICTADGCMVYYPE
jgi:hypothetical protein